MWIFKDSQKLKVEKSNAAEVKIQDAGGAGARALLLARHPRALPFFWNSPSPATPHLPLGFLWPTPDPPQAGRLTPILAFCLLLTVYCFLPTACSLFAASGLYEVREVKPNVFVWVPDDILDQEADPQFTRAGTAGFVLTPEGVVVVDTANNPFHARELLYEIRRRTETPVRYVINTSSAGEQMLGNEVFVDQQATLISTSAAQAAMRQYRQDLAHRLEEEEGWRLQARMRGFHVTPTTQTFEDEMTLRLGGQEIRLMSLPRQEPSAKDAAVYVPGAKVLFLGELYQNQYFPRTGSRDVRRWIETLRQVEAWDVDTYVPGHGAPGGKRELAEFRGFLEWLVAQVETRIKQGKSLVQVKKDLQLSETFHWHAPERAAEALEAVYSEIVATQHAASVANRPRYQDIFGR
jgi:glyoxylase-like metal-dependent hydrolase (beta-lactamase superfamily II)